MTYLEKAIADIEGFIRCETGEAAAISQTGESYREVVFWVPDFRLTERQDTPRTDAEFVACCAFVEVTRKYAHDVMVASGLDDFSGLTLYWRMQPEMDTYQDRIFVNDAFEQDLPSPHYSARPVVGFYARFLITAKPVVAP